VLAAPYGLWRCDGNFASQEKSMRREILGTIALGVITLVVALTVVPGVVWDSQAQDSKTPHLNMTPLEQYLMERNTEIALARSAVRESISRDAEAICRQVVGRDGRACA
jgi:hypothetical protein